MRYQIGADHELMQGSMLDILWARFYFLTVDVLGLLTPQSTENVKYHVISGLSCAKLCPFLDGPELLDDADSKAQEHQSSPMRDATIKIIRTVERGYQSPGSRDPLPRTFEDESACCAEEPPATES
ncbi:uncharacterized protein BDCG_16755 [Blastomyces dermatitidis ER-3]|uniref:Uncharacterized protein n=2 Tax=Blastomyces TaxID=229219 RepID=A0A179UEY9_BLAGS|nr:uncharacterized protein BDBG_02058 [Blastomyces gilchristii SLH14081]XP_045280472.1 uncharacterized protein BDCG_16755 [Blastomyces dermatitidis ER-3]OAT00745.1 hypothetical protein BDCG_16755 [Blastomyces dermatitidis ER-3]OAT05717.1 hypothetical protein BDBG_02058 [Blastomyces gilchristii SLH14081]